MNFIVDNRLLFHPGGTVAQAFGGASKDASAVTLADEVLAAMSEEELAQREVDGGILFLANELVAMQDGLSEVHARALFMLVWVSLKHLKQGSTRIPVDTTPGGFLANEVAHLIPRSLIECEHQWQLDRLLRAMDELLLQQLAAQIIGVDGAYTPIIWRGQHLYHQRVLHFEERLLTAVLKRIKSGEHTGSPNTFDDENIQKHLRDILARAPQDRYGKAMQLNSEQQYGVLTALHMPLTLITGGPGTGKTSIVVSILRMLLRLGVPLEDIALAAPTGKAANRMGESIESQLLTLGSPDTLDTSLLKHLPTPRTLHRLLGYSPMTDTFSRHRNNRLQAKFVIVDEASMIDLFLVTRLFEATRDDAHLILLGDAQQLPSVDTGAVFQELVPQSAATDAPWRKYVQGELGKQSSNEATAQCTVRLQQSYRMNPAHVGGRKILQLAQNIQMGHDPRRYFELSDDHDGKLLIQTVDSVEGVAFEGVEFISTTRNFDEKYNLQLQQVCATWYHHRIANLEDYTRLIRRTYHFSDKTFSEHDIDALNRLFEHYASARMLAITRSGPTGTSAINASFHQLAARHIGSSSAYDFVIGEPVMMTRNDYERRIFNGDHGVVLWVKSNDNARANPMVVFKRIDGYVAFQLEILRNHLEHAFALTVHKSQGSEFRHLALILPHGDSVLLTREILYTGLTRASHSVLFLGHTAFLGIGAGRTIQRFSGVSEALQRLDSHHAATAEKKVDTPSKTLQGELFSME